MQFGALLGIFSQLLVQVESLLAWTLLPGQQIHEALAA